MVPAGWMAIHLGQKVRRSEDSVSYVVGDMPKGHALTQISFS